MSPAEALVIAISIMLGITLLRQFHPAAPRRLALHPGDPG